MAVDGYLQDVKKQRALLITLLVSGFTTMMNTSTVNIALPSLMHIFDVELHIVQWIIVGYMLTLSMTMPLVGYLGSRYSYRRLYLSALVVMGIAAACCATAQNIYMLVFFRLIKGAAAGLIIPCTMTLLYKFIPKKKQAGYLGLSIMASSLGPAFGPTIAGFLLSAFNWHSLFLVNIPLVAVAFALGSHSIPTEDTVKGEKMDFVGVISVAIGTALVLIGFTMVQDWGWTSWRFIGCVVLGILLISAFIYLEQHNPVPLLNFRVLKYPPFVITVIINCSFCMSLTITPVLMAMYLQTIQGHTPLEAGLILMLPSLVMVLGNFCSRFLIRVFTNKQIVMFALLSAALGNYLMSQAWLETSVAWITLFMSIRYLGLGLISMPLTDYGMGAIPPELSGHGSAFFNWSKQITSVVAVNILTVVLSLRMLYHYADEGFAGEAVEGTASFNLAEMQAVNDVFFYITVILLLTAAVCMAMMEHKAKQRVLKDR